MEMYLDYYEKNVDLSGEERIELVSLYQEWCDGKGLKSELGERFGESVTSLREDASLVTHALYSITSDDSIETPDWVSEITSAPPTLPDVYGIALENAREFALVKEELKGISPVEMYLDYYEKNVSIGGEERIELASLYQEWCDGKGLKSELGERFGESITSLREDASLVTHALYSITSDDSVETPDWVSEITLDAPSPSLNNENDNILPEDFSVEIVRGFLSLNADKKIDIYVAPTEDGGGWYSISGSNVLAHSSLSSLEDGMTIQRVDNDIIVETSQKRVEGLSRFAEELATAYNDPNINNNFPSLIKVEKEGGDGVDMDAVPSGGTKPEEEKKKKKNTSPRM